MAPRPNRTFLYYSGPANDEGEWLCSDGPVKITDVLDLAVELELLDHLEIDSDSNNSYKLCFEAEKWWKTMVTRREEDEDLEQVVRSL